MKKFKVLLILCLSFISMGVLQAQSFGGGAGTEGDPYQVATAAHLNEVRNYLSAHYIQTANIDLTEATSTPGGAYWNGGLGWNPIGKSTSTFTGRYDGNGKKIIGLTINRPTEEQVGLFGYTSGAVLRNISIEGGSISALQIVGGLVGWPSSYSKIIGCSNTGSVTSGSSSGANTGGIAGVLDDVDTLLNCWASGNVTGYNQVGGLFGNNIRSGVYKCYATGNVSGNLYVGGLGGFSNSHAQNSYATGNVTGNTRVGGFLGHLEGGTSSYCYSTGQVPASGSFIGGFIGSNNGTCSNSYWDTQTSGTLIGIAGGNTTSGATGKTTAEMKTQATFSGWNFSTIWQITVSEYPDLQSNSRPPVYDLHLFLTRDNTDVNANILYPKVGFGSDITSPFSWTPVSPDWTYNAPKCTIYVVPTSDEGMVGSSFVITFDPTKATVAASAGGNNLFDSGIFYTYPTGDGRLKVNTSNISSAINVTPGSNKYLAMLVFTMLKPGYMQVGLDSLDFRQYDTTNNEQVSLTTTDYTSDIKFYLGDVASSSAETTGDGLINVNDLSLFATSYWSIHSQSSTLYKSKFDIGPTNVSGNYFALPTPDGTINFEDLVIFSVGYGKSAGSQLPKINTTPFSVTLGEQLQGKTIRVPVTLSGKVADVRAMSFTFKTGMKLTGVEKAGAMNTSNGFVIFKQEGDVVSFDAAVIGSEVSGISEEGTIAYLVFENKGNISLEEVIARDSWNQNLPTFMKGNSLENAVPESFSLLQNYPNPFNPSTMISFALPAASQVTLKVFNALGQEVATLINNELFDAGTHAKSFDAADMVSGMYIYKLTAGNFTAVKKMVLIK